MLNRSRGEVLSNLQYKLENDLNNIMTEDGGFSKPTNTWYGTPWMGDSYMSAPDVAAGWPPELLEYIKRVSMATAIAIVDAIYTEQEMENKVDEILLDNEN